jgi:hypothetical protein
MKNSTFKTLLAVSALSVASGYTVLAQAHCIGQQVVLPTTASQYNPSEIVNDSTSPSQFDTYSISCPATTSYLQGRVSRIATGPGNLTLQMVSPGNVATTPATDTGGDTGMRCDSTADFITDTTPGGVFNAATNDGVTGPFRSSVGGAGLYTAIVSKDDVGASGTYNGEFHCFTAANVELNGIIVTRGINN